MHLSSHWKFIDAKPTTEVGIPNEKFDFHKQISLPLPGISLTTLMFKTTIKLEV